MSTLAFATQGSGGDDESRLRTLLERTNVEFIPFDKKDKRGSTMRILRRARARDFDLLIMEGSGIAGGIALVLARWLYGVPYVFSSGDAIAPYLSSKVPLAKLIFWLYERSLCRLAAGFIGWTPYLAGRALTLGAPKAMTACGWAPFATEPAEQLDRRQAIRRELGIAPDAVVFGIVGSLNWSKRFSYCYGLELVQAVLRAATPNVCVLIVGDGTGMAHLREAAGPLLGRQVFLPGRVARRHVQGYLAAMDVGSLPQSVDQVGSFRYTTKLSEYVAAGIPFVTNEIPLAYDLDFGGLWRLPGRSPWDPVFLNELSALMASIEPACLILKKAAASRPAFHFCRERQIQHVTSFLEEIFSSHLNSRLTHTRV